MSERWPGGLINQTAPVPSGPFATSAASGVWTLDQQAYWQQQGNWPTAGKFITYVEDVFSTYLYTGNGTYQTINNGIDLAGKGGLVWIKKRNGIENNYLYDTVQGLLKGLVSNNTNLAGDYQVVSSFNSNGYTDSYFWSSSETVVSWTFREQPKFFDVVTYTGNNDTPPQTINHNLGSVPGMIIVKCTSEAGFDWAVYHRSLGATKFLRLNSTGQAGTSSAYWNDTEPTSTEFTVGSQSNVNRQGRTYVAYLFAHDAGGFGTTGTDNVISCGSFTTDSSGNATVNLGYEPQWLLVKTNGTSDVQENGSWRIVDMMRGLTAPATNVTYANSAVLIPNTTAAEVTQAFFSCNSTGFSVGQINPSKPYIYMAIRRPMKVPTDATTVFSSSANKPNSAGDWSLTTFVDLMLMKTQSSTQGWYWKDRLRGANSSGTINLNSADTSSESTYGNPIGFERNVNFLDDYYGPNGYAGFGFKRAPGFFDVVCYTGTGSATTQTHNLGVAPELMIFKKRSGASNWSVYSKSLSATDLLYLSYTNGAGTDTSVWNSTAPTSSVFSVGTNSGVNTSGGTYVAYLFATCAGVSKVGSYTGTGAARTIDCGFTGGARFVLIKATSQTGNWYVWDTARGMVSGTDPSLALNTTTAQQNYDNVYTVATGFQIVASPAFGINDSGQTYIFLAIA